MPKAETSTNVDTEKTSGPVGPEVPTEIGGSVQNLSHEEPAIGGSSDKRSSSDSAEPTNPDSSGEAEPETFDREYVEKLRKEAAEHRVKAKDRDDLAQRLHTALVAQSGALADPTDLAYDEAHLSDPDALTAAIEALVTAKPHLAARTPRGDVGQGSTKAAEGVDLAAILRGAL